MKKAIQFGAGNIGRGFIGYLLHESGYHVVFADVVEPIINQINSDGEYTIHIKDVDSKDVKISNISGVSSIKDEIYPEIMEAEVITTAVGPLVLKKIAPTIAKGILMRLNAGIDKPLNIIACENAVYASNILRDAVLESVSKEDGELILANVGFPNCSVDRIVPPSKNEKPLDVTVEGFYEWNVEKSGFVKEIPEITGMNLADNLLAYIERKLFTLNTGHAITAYLGNLNGLSTIDRAIADEKIKSIVKAAMQESGNGLIEKFDFDKDAHYQYIEKILKRFKNPYLNDDVTRVGREPLRKLSPEDRLIKPLNTALGYGFKVDNLLIGIAAALRFNTPKDPQSIELQSMIKEKGVKDVIKKVTQLKDEAVIDRIVEEYEKLK